MTRRLENKTALVTGSTSNIGREVAVAFGGEGAHVIVSGRDDARGQAVVARIRDAGGKADYVHADLGGAAASRALAEEATGLLGGRVDILVNNAGIYPGHTTLETDEEEFDRVYAVNVKAPFFLTGAFAPRMAANGGGAIVNVSTMVASFGAPGMALYGSTKAALELLTKAWAAEYGPQGVRVNAIAPGPTRTPGTEPMGDGLDQLAATLPLGRPASADEVGNAALFLGSEEASYINGAVLAVDGGRTAV